MSSSTSSLVPVFGTVFVEGVSKPVFAGSTALPFPKRENMFRRVLRTAHPTARKVCLTVLNAAEFTVPEWFTRCGGKFLFSETEIKTPLKTQGIASPAKKKARKAPKKQKKAARKPVKAKKRRK